MNQRTEQQQRVHYRPDGQSVGPPYQDPRPRTTVTGRDLT